MEKLFLLDAYALIYRAYYALIRTPRVNSKGFNTSAVFGFVNTLEELLNKEQPTHIGVAFDPAGPTFRHKAFPEYKAQRESTPEDIRRSVPFIKDIIRAYNIPILEVAGYEADDVIGTISYEAEKSGIQTFMVTPDKDYGQLITPNVFQYKPGKNGFELVGEKEIQEKYGIISPVQVIDILGLMGDSVDNVPGCPGVGEKTAESLIKTFKSIENIYENIDKVKGKLKEKLTANEKQVLFSKFLVTIKKDVPIPFHIEEYKKEPCDKEKLKSIFEELEFKSFIKKICSSQPKEGSVQLDLFSEIPDKLAEKDFCTNVSEDEFENLSYKLIENQNEVEQSVDEILTNKKVSLALATTSLDGITGEITGIALSTEPGNAFFVPFGINEAECNEKLTILKNILESENISKIAYNFKYIQVLLAKNGIELKGDLFDIMIAHYLIQPELQHHLSYISETYLHHPGQNLEKYFGVKWEDERNLSSAPIEVQKDFLCEQADEIIRLEPILKKELEEYNEKDLFENIEMPLTRVLSEMEENGVLVDLPCLKETSKLFTARMKEYEQKVFELSNETFNLSSPKQVGEVLFGKMQLLEKPKKTKTGQYVTSESILEELRYKSPVVDNILKFRSMKKLIGTYLDALPALVNPITGRIHTNFNQTVTSTGRLSSSNPNLQSIPVRGDDGKEIRKAFIAEPGCKFFSADYSQIELRIMAHLSGDKHLIEAFNQGYDIHAATAAKIYHKDIEEISSDERRKAKTANFGIIYGITVFGLAQRIGISRTEAKELIDNYFTMFPSVRTFMDSSIEFARKNGYIETLFHRRRYLPDITSQNSVVRGYAERNAINAPIQGSAADIIKKAMVGISNNFHVKQLKSKMILQVHDELNFNVVTDEEHIVEKIVKHEMENACTLSVPLVADCGWGNNWLEAH